MQPKQSNYRGPAIVLLTALAMLAWSWQTWCDPLVDFGTQIYVAWRMTAGQVLYRDLTYYNGPLSQYLNVAMFELLGVSVRTLIIENLLVLTGVMILIYRLAARASGTTAAVACGVTFSLVFGFGQWVGIANYNWVTPYHSEITHGIALGLLAIALLDRYQRSGRIGWLAGAGISTGLAFLTKAEPSMGAAAAMSAMLLARWWTERATIGVIAKEAGISAGAFLLVPLLAIALLSLQMPMHVAAMGVAGSWPWVFDSRITALPFYRNIAGTDDLAGNISTICCWTAIYAVLTGAAWLLAFTVKSRRRWATAVVFVTGAVGMVIVVRTLPIDWNSIIRPLPVCLFAILIAAALPIARRVRTGHLSSLRFGLVVFAMAMLAKISLNAHIYHYGFGLAMPGMLILVAVLITELPELVNRRGGNGNMIRAVAAVCWGTMVFLALYMDNRNFSGKLFALGAKGDTIRVNSRGAEVRAIVDEIRRYTPENSTLIVLPQGLMVNYLARRVDPIPYINFMPPEVLIEGEDTIIAAMAAQPPDRILINYSSVQGGEFTLDYRYSYGKKTFDWVQQNYLPTPLPSVGNLYGFVLMEKKKT